MPLRKYGKGRSLVALKRGFKRLSEEDQEMLRKWFSVNEGASITGVCRVIAEHAPEIVYEGLLKATQRKRN